MAQVDPFFDPTASMHVASPVPARKVSPGLEGPDRSQERDTTCRLRQTSLNRGIGKSSCRTLRRRGT